MNYIKLFEEFTEKKLSTNNSTYNNYYKEFSGSKKDRANMVAWS